MMKKIIILQNSTVFTVDIAKIYNPHLWELHLIVNQKSYECLCERNQDNLLKTITILQDFDFDTLKNRIGNIIQNFRQESIVISTNSESIVAVAGKLRDFFNITGLNAETANIFTDKVHMKKYLAKFNVRLPHYICFDRDKYINSPRNYINIINQQLSFPIIAKPVDSTGSHGVIKIHDTNELHQWANTIENNMYELDEFIEGDLYHCDSLVHNGNIIHTAVCRYSYLPHQFMLGNNLGSITLPTHDPDYVKLKIFNNDILKMLSTNFSGVTHLEAFQKPNGELVFLEVANRGGGAGIPRMYHKHLNIDLFSTHFLLQCDDNYQANIQCGNYAAWLQFPPSSNVTSLEDIPPIKSEFHLITTNKKIGAHSSCTSLRDYTILIILWNENFVQLQHDFDFLSCYHNERSEKLTTQ